MIDMESCPKCGWAKRERVDTHDYDYQCDLSYHAPETGGPEYVKVLCPRCGYCERRDPLDAGEKPLEYDSQCAFLRSLLGDIAMTDGCTGRIREICHEGLAQ